jgi:hypothetical protein
MAYKRVSPQPVVEGGTGAMTLTANSLLLGNGTLAISALGAATNGQIAIGSTGMAPSLATITPGTGISISNGAGSITISATGTSTFNYTAVSTTPYVVAATDDYLGVTSSSMAITVELPNAPATGRAYIIKDTAGSAATNNITITTVGGSVDIDGATSFVMNTNYQSANVVFNGTAYEVW